MFQSDPEFLRMYSLLSNLLAYFYTEEVVDYSFKYTKPDIPVFGPAGTHKHNDGNIF
jgi:hypothetical protein